MRYCTHCGYPMAADDLYCANCGLKGDQPAPYAPATEAETIRWELGPQWVPHTIPELARWYEECGFPAYEQSRMFVGQDSSLSPCLGVFHNTVLGCCETYENQRDGTRRIRHRGTEAAAVA